MKIGTKCGGCREDLETVLNEIAAEKERATSAAEQRDSGAARSNGADGGGEPKTRRDVGARQREPKWCGARSSKDA